MGRAVASQSSFHQKGCFLLFCIPDLWVGFGQLKKLPHLEAGKRLDRMILRSLPALTFCQDFVTFSKLSFGRLSGCLKHQEISRWLQGRVSFLKTMKKAHSSPSPFVCGDGPACLQTPHSHSPSGPCSFLEHLPSLGSVLIYPVLQSPTAQGFWLHSVINTQSLSLCWCPSPFEL